MPCIHVDTNTHNIIIQRRNWAIEQRDTKKHAKRHCVSRDTSWAPGFYSNLKQLMPLTKADYKASIIHRVAKQN